MKKKFVASMFALALAAATIAPTVAHAEKKPGIQDGSVLWKTTGNTKTDFGLSLNYEDALKPTYSGTVRITVFCRCRKTDQCICQSISYEESCRE